MSLFDMLYDTIGLIFGIYIGLKPPNNFDYDDFNDLRSMKKGK